MFDSYVRYHGRHRPHATALGGPAGEISYGSLDRMVDQVAAGLAREGADSARLAAVRMSSGVYAWIVLLALARLGVGTASVSSDQDIATLQAVGADLLVTDEEDASPAPSGMARLAATRAWLAARLEEDGPPFASRRVDPGAIGRVILSSGTTGARKAIPRSWAEVTTAVERRQVMSAVFRPPFHVPPQRVLKVSGMETISFFHCLMIWASGDALLIASTDIAAEDGALHRLTPSVLVASPLQLERMLALLPAGAAAVPGLTVLTGGSHLPATLVEALRRRLAPAIWNIYGSTEADLVAVAEAGRLPPDPTASGWAPPGVEIEVVDEGGALLPPGEIGVIRVRTPSLVQGYLGDEAATAEHFRDGWFYSGDVGSLDADGLLRVEGRVSELMNFGGQKVMAIRLEEAVRACPGVLDVAAFGAADAFGLEKPWLAIVRGEGFVEAQVVQALGPFRLPPVFLAWVEAIPRNAGGKIDRLRLRAAAQARGG